LSRTWRSWPSSDEHGIGVRRDPQVDSQGRGLDPQEAEHVVEQRAHLDLASTASVGRAYERSR
jgi:hypothetical protein